MALVEDHLMVGLTQKQKAVAARCTPFEREFVFKWIAMGCDPKRGVEALLAAYGDAPPDLPEASLKKKVKRLTEKQSVNDFIDVIREHSIHHAIMEKEEAQILLSFRARAHIADALEWSEYIAGYNDDGEPVYQTAWRLKNAEDMPVYMRCAIKSLAVTADGKPKMELHDSIAALRLLAEIKGWKAPVRNEVTGKDGAPLDQIASEEELKALLDQSTAKILAAL